MNTFDLCSGVSYILLLSCYYFERQKGRFREEIKNYFSEKGVNSSNLRTEGLMKAQELYKTDEYLHHLVQNHQLSQENSKISLLFSVSLLAWCFTL
jgi:hypothetical protein